MIYDKNVREESYNIMNDDFLFLLPVPKSHKLFVKWFRDHYPDSKGIVGRQINFIIYSYGEPIGIIGFASPPLNYKKFHEYFKFSEEKEPSEVAKTFLNNNVFRIVHTQKNLGTQILKKCRQRLPKMYKDKYNDELIGLVTFVEPPRTVAMYKADNWDYIGKTKGIEVTRSGDDWTSKQYNKNGVKKHIFGYKFQ